MHCKAVEKDVKLFDSTSPLSMAGIGPIADTDNEYCDTSRKSAAFGVVDDMCRDDIQFNVSRAFEQDSIDTSS
jgi:hypothetical protein